MFYRLGNSAPTLLGEYFVADNASVIGDVRLGNGASVWFNAVVRADLNRIELGEDCNVQDHALLHVEEDEPVVLGRGVSVAHHAVVHGCRIGDYSLVGANAVVLSGASVGRYCVIGAGSLVSEGTVIPDGSLVIGNPGRVLMPVGDDKRQLLEHMAKTYREHGGRVRRELAPWLP